MKSKVIDLYGNSTVQNEDVKYSSLLEKFISPFSRNFIDPEYVDEVFEFAINAWNLGNMKNIMQKLEFEETINAIEEHDVIDTILLNELINYKCQNSRNTHILLLILKLKKPMPIQF